MKIFAGDTLQEELSSNGEREEKEEPDYHEELQQQHDKERQKYLNGSRTPHRADSRLRKKQPQLKQQPLSQQPQRHNVSASSHRRDSCAAALKLRAAAIRNVIGTHCRYGGSALMSIASLAWKACRVDGMLLLLAAGPAASTTFAASLRGSQATLAGWHLLFSWKAALPLLLFACCCAAFYSVAHKRRSHSSKDMRLPSPTCAFVNHWSSVVGRVRTEALLSSLRKEGSDKPLPTQQKPLQEVCSVATSDMRGSQQGQQEQQGPRPLPLDLLAAHQSSLESFALPSRLHPVEHPKKSVSTNVVVSQYPAAARDEDYRAPILSSWPLTLGGYSEGERILEDDPDGLPFSPRVTNMSIAPTRNVGTADIVFGSAAGAVASPYKSSLMTGLSQTSGQCRPGRERDKGVSETIKADKACCCCAYPHTSECSVSTVSTTGRSERSHSTTRRRKTAEQGNSGKAGDTCCCCEYQHTPGAPVPVSAATRRSGRSHPTTTRRKTAEQGSSMSVTACRCLCGEVSCALERKGSQDILEYASESAAVSTIPASVEPSGSETKEDDDMLGRKRVAGSQRVTAAASAKDGSSSESAKSVSTASCEKSSGMSLFEGGRCTSTVPTKHFYPVLRTSTAFSACNEVYPSTKASVDRRNVVSPHVRVTGTLGSDTSLDAGDCQQGSAKGASQRSIINSWRYAREASQSTVITPRRCGVVEKRGRCPSSAVVAALLFPMFLCCSFPVYGGTRTATGSRETTEHALDKGSLTTSVIDSECMPDQGFETLTRFPSVPGEAIASVIPLLLSDDMTAVLLLIMSLLPGSLVAGSLVSLLLWHLPPATVRFEECVLLLFTYATAWVCTVCCSSQPVAVECGSVHVTEPAGAPPLHRGIYAGEGAFTRNETRATPSLWGQVCFCGICAAVIVACMALQLVFFHACFRKAPRCFSLVEGSLVAQLSTALTCLCVASVYCFRRIPQYQRVDGEKLQSDLPSRSVSRVDNVRKVYASSPLPASWGSQPLNSTLKIPTPLDAGWICFAIHMWSLLLVFIACSLVFTFSSDSTVATLSGTRKAVEYQEGAKRAKGHTETHLNENDSSKRLYRKAVAVLPLLFLLSNLVYLCGGSVKGLAPSSSALAKGMFCTSDNRIVSTNVRPDLGTGSEDNLISSAASNYIPNNRSKGSRGRLSRSQAVLAAEYGAFTEMPLAWLLRLVFGDARHTWLLLWWLTLSVVGILSATVVAARAASYESAPTAPRDRGATVGSTASRAGYAVHNPAENAATDPIRVGIVEGVNRTQKGTMLKLFARKLFHFVLVAVVATGYYAGAYAFTALALCGLLWILVVCEYIRVSHLSLRLSSTLTAFFSRFVDSRDQNGLFLTHTYLLLGVALPFIAGVAQGALSVEAVPMPPASVLTSSSRSTSVTAYFSWWLSSAAQERIKAASCIKGEAPTGQLVHSRSPSAAAPVMKPVSRPSGEAVPYPRTFEEPPPGVSVCTLITLQSLLGLLLVGVGDAVAALVGVRWGRRRLPFTKSKTYLGAAAFFTAPGLLFIPLVALTSTTSTEQWLSLCAGLLAIASATLFEAYTPDIDNCILSLFGVVAYNGILPLM